MCSEFQFVKIGELHSSILTWIKHRKICALCFKRRRLQEKSRAHGAAERKSMCAMAWDDATLSTVIAREGGAIQYSRDACDEIDKPRRTGYPRSRV
jgi:hypothetical protein